MKQIRVVVTGMGVVSPLGISLEDFWAGLVSGKCGIGPITLFDTEGFPVTSAAEVKDFDPGQFMHLKRADRAGRCAQFAIAAAKMALEQSGLVINDSNNNKIGVVIGTSGMPELLAEQAYIIDQKGANRVDPLVVSQYRASMVPSHVGLELGAKGINTTVNSACASGNDSIGTALRMIRSGLADVIFAGGAGANVTPLAIAATARIGALARGAGICRPFDLNRKGFVYGEGGAMLVLESLEHARKRNARVLAEIAGAGWSFDAASETSPVIPERIRSMTQAISDAGIDKSEIGYINAHGTGTQLNDTIETSAIKAVFGERAYEIPVSSNKSMIGHLGCASGSVEAIACIMGMENGIVPPTINYETPDPECDLDYVPNVSREWHYETCLSNAFGLGGQNCSLVIKRFED
jgi:3-oxoacyl-[acyl-carrier-protein] synthase II